MKEFLRQVSDDVAAICAGQLVDRTGTVVGQLAMSVVSWRWQSAVPSHTWREPGGVDWLVNGTGGGREVESEQVEIATVV